MQEVPYATRTGVSDNQGYRRSHHHSKKHLKSKAMCPGNGPTGTVGVPPLPGAVSLQ